VQAFSNQQFSEAAAFALSQALKAAAEDALVPQVPPPIDWMPKVLLDNRSKAVSDAPGIVMVADATGQAPAASANAMGVIAHHRALDENFYRRGEAVPFSGKPLTDSLIVDAPCFAATSSLGSTGSPKQAAHLSASSSTMPLLTPAKSLPKPRIPEDSEDASTPSLSDAVKASAFAAKHAASQRINALQQATGSLVLAGAAGVAAAAASSTARKAKAKAAEASSTSGPTDSSCDLVALREASHNFTREGYTASPLLASPRNAGLLAATADDGSASPLGESKDATPTSGLGANAIALANTLSSATAGAANQLTDLWLVGRAPPQKPKAPAGSSPAPTPCVMVPGSKKIQLFMDVNVCIFSIAERCELFFSLYSTATNGFITEDYVVNLPPPGVAEHTRILGRMKTVFHNLEVRDLCAGEIYLVCRIIRRGLLNYDEKLAQKILDKQEKGSMQVRRGFGVAVTPLNTSALLRNMTKSIDIAPNHFAIYTPNNEVDFSKLHEMLIKTLQQSNCVYPMPVGTVGILNDTSGFRAASELTSDSQLSKAVEGDGKSAAELLLVAPTPPALAAAAQLREKFCSEAPKSKGIAVSITAFFEDDEDLDIYEASAFTAETSSTPFAAAQNARVPIRKRLGIPADVASTSRLELPTLLDPTDARSDLYVWLVDGMFSQDKKSSARNIEVQISLRNKRYQIIENAIVRGAGEDPVSTYVSTTTYHCNTPSFNELIKIRVDPTVLLDDTHLFFEFWHVSNNKDKTQCFAQAYLPLVAHPGSGAPVIIPSQVHTIGTFVPLSDGKGYADNPALRVARKEWLRVRTALTSTRMTQNPIMANIAKWKQLPQHEVRNALALFLSRNSITASKELTCFLQELFSHLFAILASEDHQDLHVDAHAALMHALTLLDRQPESRMVADKLIKQQFKDPQVHQKILGVLVASLLDQLDDIVNLYVDTLSAGNTSGVVPLQSPELTSSTSNPNNVSPNTITNQNGPTLADRIKALQLRCHEIGWTEFQIASALLKPAGSSSPTKASRRGSILTSSYLSGGVSSATKSAASVAAIQAQLRDSVSTMTPADGPMPEPAESGRTSVSTIEPSGLVNSPTFSMLGNTAGPEREGSGNVLSAIAAASSAAASQAATEEDNFPLLRMARPLRYVIELAVASYRADSIMSNGAPSISKAVFKRQLQGVCTIINAFLALSVSKPEDLILNASNTSSSSSSAQTADFDHEKFGYISKAQTVLMQQTLGVLAEFRGLFTDIEIAQMACDAIRSMRCAPESSLQRLDFIRSLVDPTAAHAVPLCAATGAVPLKGLSSAQLMVCAPAIVEALSDHLRLGLATGSLNELYLVTAILRCLLPSIIPASPWKTTPLHALCDILAPTFSWSHPHIAATAETQTSKHLKAKGQCLPVAAFYPVMHALIEALHAVYVAPVAFVPGSTPNNAITAAATSPFLSAVAFTGRSARTGSSTVNLVFGPAPSGSGLSLLAPGAAAQTVTSPTAGPNPGLMAIDRLPSANLLQNTRQLSQLGTPAFASGSATTPPTFSLGSPHHMMSLRTLHPPISSATGGTATSSVVSAASLQSSEMTVTAQTFSSITTLSAAPKRLFALPSSQTTALCVVDLAVDPFVALLSLLAMCDDEAVAMFVALLPRESYAASSTNADMLVDNGASNTGADILARSGRARRSEALANYTSTATTAPAALAAALTAPLPPVRDVHFTLHALLEILVGSLTWELFPESWCEPRSFHVTTLLRAAYQLAIIMQTSVSGGAHQQTNAAVTATTTLARRPQRASILSTNVAQLRRSVATLTSSGGVANHIKPDTLMAAAIPFDSKLWAAWMKLVLELRTCDLVLHATVPVFQQLSREFLVSSGTDDVGAFALNPTPAAKIAYFFARIVRDALPPVSTENSPEKGLFNTTLGQWKHALTLAQSGITEALKMGTAHTLDIPQLLGRLFNQLWATLSDAQKVSLADPLVERVFLTLSHHAPSITDTNAGRVLATLKQPCSLAQFPPAAGITISSPWEGVPMLVALEIYQSLVQAELSSQRSLSEVERYTIDSLYEVTNLAVERGMTCIAIITEAVKQRFASDRSPEEQTVVKNFLEHISTMYNLMVQMLQLPDSPEFEDDRALVALRLLNYIERSGHRAATRKTMHTRYLQYLVNLHTNSGNHVEAGIVQLQQAKLLDWSNQVVEPYDVHPEEPERCRKERFIKLAIDNFCRAEDWARAIDRAEYLRYYYQHIIYDYAAVSKLLRDVAEYFEHMTRPKVTYPAYYRVCFYGKFDSPYLTQQCEFVYKGAPLEQIMDFTARIRKRFPGAYYHMSSEKPSEELLAKHQQIIAISKVNVCSLDQKATVKTLLEAHKRGMLPSNATFITVQADPAALESGGGAIENVSRSYRSGSIDASAGEQRFEQWTSGAWLGSTTSGGQTGFNIQPLTEMPSQLAQNAEHHKIDVFEYTRPWKRSVPNKPYNEFTDTWQIRTYVLTSESFPANRRRLPIGTRIEVVTKPIENAIEALETKTTQIAQTAASVAVQPPGPVNVGPLSMQLSGSIDASVNGGPARYIDAFLTPEFLDPKSVYWDEEKANLAATIEERKKHQAQLKDALRRQVVVLDEALEVFGARCDPKLRGLYAHLKSNLDKMYEVLFQLD